jgi:hypothetical protein
VEALDKDISTWALAGRHRILPFEYTSQGHGCNFLAYNERPHVIRPQTPTIWPRFAFSKCGTRGGRVCLGAGTGGIIGRVQMNETLCVALNLFF